MKSWRKRAGQKRLGDHAKAASRHPHPERHRRKWVPDLRQRPAHRTMFSLTAVAHQMKLRLDPRSTTYLSLSAG